MWIKKYDKILKKEYATCNLRTLAEKLGCSIGCMRYHAGLLGLHRDPEATHKARSEATIEVAARRRGEKTRNSHGCAIKPYKLAQGAARCGLCRYGSFAQEGAGFGVSTSGYCLKRSRNIHTDEETCFDYREETRSWFRIRKASYSERERERTRKEDW